ncbi:MAG: EFR1 family ferrodoxin [Treponema sp.]|nr:EFR1 family ferrodoxin [Treponema sp.]
MIIFYFSGTGNSKYVSEAFCKKMAEENCIVQSYSIEENIDFESLINNEETIGFCYPIFFSRAPRIMREFVVKYMEVLKNKKLIIFCTQMILSGDGARALLYVFPREYRRSLNVIYAEHFFMPNNVTDLFLLPVESGKKLQKYITKSEQKMQKVCGNIKNGKIKKRGFNIFSQMLGLLQAVFVTSMEKKAHKMLKINSDCNLCEICVSICPMKNLTCEDEKIVHKFNCTVCYRCINKCPQKAITFIFNGKVKKQYMWQPVNEQAKGEVI